MASLFRLTSHFPRFASGRFTSGPRAPLVAATLAVLCVGCGPYLRPTIRDVRAFAAPTACGQGPYEIELKAVGSRWGESVELAVYSSAPINMRYEILAGDQTAGEGYLTDFQVPRSTTDRDGRASINLESSDMPFDNQMCSLAHVEAALDSQAASGGFAGTARVGVSVGNAPVGTESGGGDATVVAVGEDTGEIGGEIVVDAAPTLDLVPWSEMSMELMMSRRLGMTRWVSQSWSNSDPDQGPLLAANTPIRIRLWGEVPNPLEGVTFVVRHRVNEASVSDEEYEAHLREERVEEEREQAEDERERAEDARRRAAEPVRGPSRRQRRLAARRQRRAERDQERREFCRTHHQDTSCWGEGGYEGHLQREEARRVEAEMQRLEAERVAAATIPRPDGPPPPPRVDPPPPKASANARWVVGYWHWVGVWVWIGGRWDVPEADLVAQMTVRAPSAPPAPRAESIPAPPAPGLVWTGGYWQWDGAQFVWIAGHWDVAPSGGQWQAPRWQVQGSGAIFVPGRWQIQVR